MKRVAIIGNSSGGKSTLARRLSSAWKCSHVEIDGLLWQPGWKLTPVEAYNAEHARLIAEETWIIDGLGRLDSIAARLARATDIMLIDMPPCGCTSGLRPSGRYNGRGVPSRIHRQA